jgi:hypothetical protein
MIRPFPSSAENRREAEQEIAEEKHVQNSDDGDGDDG